MDTADEKDTTPTHVLTQRINVSRYSDGCVGKKERKRESGPGKAASIDLSR
jgi:hypothetical protein